YERIIVIVFRYKETEVVNIKIMMKNVKLVEDRISTFSDGILQHILSFLDMKQVVQTSVLSSRWKSLWLSVSNLNFDEKFWMDKQTKEPKRQKFREFVDAFSLYICHDEEVNKLQKAVREDAERIYVWIAYLIKKRNVQDVRIYARLILPETKRLFNHIKILCLEWVVLCGEDSGDLLWDFPLMEKLSMINIQHMHLDSITISAPRLRYLLVESNYAYAEDCKLNIRAPNLTTLKLKGHLYKDYSLKNLSSLVTAEISYEMDWFKAIKKKVIGRCFKNILVGLANAKSLTLSVSLLQDSSELPSTLERGQISHNNIRYLKLEDLCSEEYIRPVAKLLEFFPHVETFVLECSKDSVNNWKGQESGDSSLQLAGEDYWGAQLSFQCMLHHLKCIEIQEFDGSPNEFKFFEFLLRNASVLENITMKAKEVFARDNISKQKEEELVEFSKKLKLLPKASSNVKFSLVLEKKSGRTVAFEEFSSSPNTLAEALVGK
ncbi:hypothetical protein AQUCO_00200385v1, partial [Aquilegia coerulea]